MSGRDPQVDLFSNLMVDSICLWSGGIKAARSEMDGLNGCYFHPIREKNQDISLRIHISSEISFWGALAGEVTLLGIGPIGPFFHRIAGPGRHGIHFFSIGRFLFASFSQKCVSRTSGSWAATQEFIEK